jgi:hypothetical protein
MSGCTSERGLLVRLRTILTFAAFFLPLALPILASPLPPLTDYPNHLARTHILAQLSHDQTLAQFYAADWRLLPNLAMDMLVPPLSHVVGIYWAGKLFILLTFALLLSGTLALSAAFNGKPEPAAGMAAPIIFSTAAILGVLNYLFGVGLALWGIASWIKLAKADWRIRAGVSFVFVALTFTGHLAALGIYGLGIAAYELGRLSQEKRFTPREILANGALVAVPFLPVAVLMAASHTQGGGGAVVWTLSQKLEGLRFLVRTYWWPAERIGAGLVVAGLAASYWARWWRFTPAALWLIGLSVPVYFALPYEMMGTWAVDIRVPTGLVLVLIGMVRWSFPSPRASYAFALVAFAVTLARMGGILVAFHDYDRTTRDLRASFSAIPRGSRVLLARTEPDGDMPLAIQYLPCAAVIERDSLVSVLFSDPKAQILAVKPRFRAMAGGFDDDPPPLSEILNPPERSKAAPSGRIYWKNWEQNYDFLYLLGNEHGDEPLPPSLEPVASGHNMRLYRITHPLAQR